MSIALGSVLSSSMTSGRGRDKRATTQWQDEMVEVKETFRRMARVRVRHSGFTQRREDQACPTAPTLSRNRMARRALSKLAPPPPPLLLPKCSKHNNSNVVSRRIEPLTQRKNEPSLRGPPLILVPPPPPRRRPSTARSSIPNYPYHLSPKSTPKARPKLDVNSSASLIRASSRPLNCGGLPSATPKQKPPVRCNPGMRLPLVGLHELHVAEELVPLSDRTHDRRRNWKDLYPLADIPPPPRLHQRPTFYIDRPPSPSPCSSSSSSELLATKKTEITLPPSSATATTVASCCNHQEEAEILALDSTDSSPCSEEASEAASSPTNTPHLMLEGGVSLPTLSYTHTRNLTSSDSEALHGRKKKVGSQVLKGGHDLVGLRRVWKHSYSEPNQGKHSFVAKHSADPYIDFKNSMIGMICREQLQCKENELDDLLRLYLNLNPHTHHQVLHQAFHDIKQELGNHLVPQTT